MNLSKLSLNSNCSIREAMKKMDEFAIETLFIVDDSSKLKGVVTNGDIRRSLLKGSSIDDPINECMNKNYVSASAIDDREYLLRSLKDGIKLIPIIDENHNLIDVVGSEFDEYIPIYSPYIDNSELRYVNECIKKSWISSTGPLVSEFERRFSEFTGLEDCISTSNGSTALELAFTLCNLKPEDEIIAPALTFASPVNSAIRTGAKVKLIDVDKNTMCLNLNIIKSHITSRTKVIVIVNLYGYPVNIKELRQNIPSDILIIEDCAESLGSYRDNVHCGIYSDFATFSFFGNKTITTGEGGMLFCSKKENRSRAISLRDHGMKKDKKYWHEEIGFNFRMTSLQAAVGLGQLEKIDKILDLKNKVFEKYENIFSKYGINLRKTNEKNVSDSNWLVVLRDPRITEIDLDQLQLQLKIMGIDVRKVFYPLPEMQIYKEYSLSNYENCFSIHCSSICLPSSPLLRSAQIEMLSYKILNLLKISP